jgi:hypothetical protein
VDAGADSVSAAQVGCSLGVEELAQHALELAKSLGLHPDPLQADARVGLARVHLKHSQPAHAVQLLQEADAFWRDFDPENSAARETARWLAVALDRAGNEKGISDCSRVTTTSENVVLS